MARVLALKVRETMTHWLDRQLVLSLLIELHTMVHMQIYEIEYAGILVELYLPLGLINLSLKYQICQ